MSLVKNSELIRNCLKSIFDNQNIENENVKSSVEYINLVNKICDISLKCFTKKNLLKCIENDLPKHFDTAKSNASNDNAALAEDLWIFGYGSLIWKVDFPYETCHRGYIQGYERRFYQNSLDHRGTPEQPGRVVTCIPSTEESKVYGMAYKIADDQKQEVLSHLDYREKNGYERCNLNFHHYPDENGQKFNVIMYIATAENDSYAGHISKIDDIAEQIYWAWGPSGSNREYVFNLYTAMKILFPDVNDQHLIELNDLLRDRERLDLKIEENIKRSLTNDLIQVLKVYKNDTQIIHKIDGLIQLLQKENYQKFGKISNK